MWNFQKSWGKNSIKTCGQIGHHDNHHLYDEDSAPDSPMTTDKEEKKVHRRIEREVGHDGIFMTHVMPRDSL